MLIITRKQNESLIIDLGSETIEITITEIGKQVRLGIDAPKGCKIWRKELFATVEQNKQAVADTKTQNLRDILQTIQKHNDSK